MANLLDEARNLYRPPIYISGPMTGHSQWNFPAFERAAEQLRAGGWHVHNPAEENADKPAGFYPRHKYLARDVYVLITYCRAIALLDGWEHSEGALLEAQIAVDLHYDLFLCPPNGGLQYRSRSDIEEVLNGGGASKRVTPRRLYGQGLREARNGPGGNAEGSGPEALSHPYPDVLPVAPGGAHDEGGGEVRPQQLEEGLLRRRA